jgi:hypothetical protein
MQRGVTYLIVALLAWLGVAGIPGPVLSRDGSAAPQKTSSPTQRERSRNSYIVSFGLFGPQSVFESEARGAARIFQQRLRSTAAPIVSFNRKRGGLAATQTLAAALRTAGAAMDPDNGLLVLILTSHGSPEGLAIVAGNITETLTPLDLRSILDASGAKYRIVIISACYSGVFLPALADPRTLVITAAAADRPSFGCEDGAKWTYFGEAFFNQALRTAPDLEAAFQVARRLVTARERREGFEPSLPQMAGGSEVLARLARRDWPAQRRSAQ